MDRDLGNHRKSYEKSALIEEAVAEDAMEQFQLWFEEVEDSEEIEEPNAMTIATIGTDGFPKSRVVLLKKYTWEGFIFYTNYMSEKGKAISANPRVCLSFFWPTHERQVIIKGEAQMISPGMSDDYFESRPDASKLGAVVSEQSSVIPSREFLEEALEELKKEVSNREIKRPENWGGYVVKPFSLEFWQGRPNRLHDRIRYTLREDSHWKIERLAP
jgi:pyridoxamine 5'-phosphate oxidase